MKNLTAAIICFLLALTFCSQAFRGYYCAENGICLVSEFEAEESGDECADGEDDPEKIFPERRVTQPLTGHAVRFPLPYGNHLHAIAGEILSPPPRG